jgi:hypothetical protein
MTAIRFNIAGVTRHLNAFRAARLKRGDLVILKIGRSSEIPVLSRGVTIGYVPSDLRPRLKQWWAQAYLHVTVIKAGPSFCHIKVLTISRIAPIPAESPTRLPYADR